MGADVAADPHPTADRSGDPARPHPLPDPFRQARGDDTVEAPQPSNTHPSCLPDPFAGRSSVGQQARAGLHEASDLRRRFRACCAGGERSGVSTNGRAVRTWLRWRSSTAPCCARVTTTAPASPACAGRIRWPPSPPRSGPRQAGGGPRPRQPGRRRCAGDHERSVAPARLTRRRPSARRWPRADGCAGRGRSGSARRRDGRRRAGRRRAATCTPTGTPPRRRTS